MYIQKTFIFLLWHIKNTEIFTYVQNIKTYKPYEKRKARFHKRYFFWEIHTLKKRFKKGDKTFKLTDTRS